MNTKLVHNIHLALVFVTAIMNIVFYSKLPQKVAMHLSISGEASNYVSKSFFVFVAPLIVLLTWLLSKFGEETKSIKYAIVGLVIFIINIVFLFVNL